MKALRSVLISVALLAVFVGLFVVFEFGLAVCWRVFSCGLWDLPDKTFLERYGFALIAVLLSFLFTYRFYRKHWGSDS